MSNLFHKIFAGLAAIFVTLTTPAATPTPLPTPTHIITTTPKPSPTTTSVEILTLTYQPLQCDKNPWEVWYELGEVKFIKEPTDLELITAYYSSQSIPIKNVIKLESDLMACEACSVCPTSYHYQLQTDRTNLDKLQATGWKLKP